MSNSDHRPLTGWIRGYADPLCARAGARIAIKASTDLPTLRGRLVRLRHGDTHPNGPGLLVEPVPDSPVVDLPGRRQPLVAGSYLEVPHAPALDLATLSLELWVQPTLLRDEPVALAAKHDGEATGSGFTLWLEGARPVAVLGWGAEEVRLVSGAELVLGRWHALTLTIDGPEARATLTHRPASDGALGTETQLDLGRPWRCACRAPLRLGAGPGGAAPQGRTFTGRLGHPRLSGDGALVAAWDLASDAGSTRVIDRGPHGLHAEAINMPTRGVTDHEWDGQEIDWRHGRGYGAVHLHEDDLEDARWETDLELVLPEDLPSGVYAAELAAPETTEHVTFFVLPPRGRATADVAVLFPTFTYLAYGNERGVLDPEMERFAWVGSPVRPDPASRFALQEPGLGPSLYDVHVDGSPCVLASRLRPLSTLRPTERYPLLGAPRNLAADLYLVDWLDHEGVAFDALTDDALHAEGAALLAPYRVLITGGHPEYWSGAMLDALERWLAAGGRLMYLGGNGFYWVTGVHRERPHVIEVRRGLGWRPEQGQRAGEGYLATTGEPGGLWQDRGRPPHRLVGVGFAAEGRGGPAAGYVRTRASLDPRASFVFEGVEGDRPIGEFGLVEGGAAGDELDRADVALGTPAHALVLATSQGRHGHHVRLFDPLLLSAPADLGVDAGGPDSPDVRADMVLFETRAGGAVFSVGSISWRGALSHGGYENDVSRITRNVLARFRDAAPFPFA